MNQSFGIILNQHTIRFERVIPISPELLWKYFAEPEYSSKWLLNGGARLDSGLVDMTANEKDPDGNTHRIIGLVQEVEHRCICFRVLQLHICSGAATGLLAPRLRKLAE
jgi:hypothetical protein